MKTKQRPKARTKTSDNATWGGLVGHLEVSDLFTFYLQTVAVDIDAEKIALASGVEDKDLTYFQKEKIMKRLSINRNRSGINNLSQKRSQSCDNLNISSRSRIKIGRRQSDQTGKVSSADQIVVQFPSQTKCENPNSIETVAEEA